MKIFFTIVFLASALSACGQYSHIELGKRYNPIFAPEIKAENVGHHNTAYRKLFFKLQEDSDFRYAGLFGGKIKDHIDLSIPEVYKAFKKYQNKKRWSYALAGAAIACVEIWAYQSFLTMVERGEITIGAYFSKRSLPWLISYLIAAYPSTYINYKADYDLLEAVRFHNQVYGL